MAQAAPSRRFLLDLRHWQDGSFEPYKKPKLGQKLFGPPKNEEARRLAEGRIAVLHETCSLPARACNELDLIAVCRNRVLAVECKTGALREDQGSDAIYKRKQVAQAVGGRLVTPRLLNARRLPDGPRARARSDGVVLLEGEELARLPEALRTWVSG